MMKNPPSTGTPAGWHARLDLAYAHEDGRCSARFSHKGPLRILQTLHPEGPAVAHNVLVHPPGGLVGGDVLEIDVKAGLGSHGLVTTPGAARFYRSQGPAAVQHTRVTLEPGARLEWLPLEAICYSGCRAENHLVMELAPGAEMMGWDMTALGLPASGQPFEQGSFTQHMEVRGAWLERARIDARDGLLLDGPLGLAGHRCMATLFFVAGEAISRSRRELALEAVRAVVGAHEALNADNRTQRTQRERRGREEDSGVRLVFDDSFVAGLTSPGPQVLVLRVLAPVVEPAFALLKAARGAWREALWSLPAVLPRTWAL